VDYIRLLSGIIAMKKLITLLILLLSICSLEAQNEDTTELDDLFLIELDSLVPTDTFSVFVTYTETNPQFPGGDVEFYRYVLSNLEYPMAARAADIEGKVIISFEILSDGTVNKNSVTVVSSSSQLLNQEAMRLIQNSPPWIAATITKEDEQPRPIDSRISLPIPFRLGN
jgi:TonB family protein